MSQDNSQSVSPIQALFAELGIVDPIAIANAREQHAEVIAAYQNGKLTEAALRHSLARSPDDDDEGTPKAGSAVTRQTER
ncbi:hypothetical protein [Rhizobium sp. S163]|uniref:hypothetical protein n=1 Tax=Rhizobium sp. S163 TaxID=3055039 RepID=UPI0025A966B3|nr:hypothetical protein [Rhizobium sp. S163]MDM9646459.1 hypothetical protein [Rhizobium sp. S163]